MPVSQRAQNTPVFSIYRYQTPIRKAEESGVTVWRLHEGDPRLPTPKILFEKLQIYQETTISYLSVAGLDIHLHAWKKAYADLGINTNSLEIVPTLGASEALLAALFVTTDPQDHILVFEPFYPGYLVASNILGCTLIPIPTTYTSGFSIPPIHELEAFITPHTRAILLTNPDNPTGRVLSTEQLRQLDAFAERHHLTLIVNETYRELVHDKQPNPSALMVCSSEHVLVIDSLSKRYGVPGMRVGSLVTRNPTVAERAKTYLLSRACAPRIEHIISSALLTHGESIISDHRQEISNRIGVILNELEGASRLQFHKPQGGLFVVVKAPGIDAQSFQRFLIEDFRFEQETVSILPMLDCYLSPNMGQDEFRIAAVYPEPSLRRAIRLLVMALDTFYASSNHIRL